MATISKPDANPILALVLTWLGLGLGHLIVNGQQKKWLMTLAATILGSMLCLLPGTLIAILSIIDSYMTASRLQAGEEIPEGEYSLPLLYRICKIIHTDATCSAAEA